jgi:hypothetical protein
MKLHLPLLLVKGIISGAFVGFLVGAYVVFQSEDRVIRRDDFTHPVTLEQAQERYSSTVILAFVMVFAVIGPYIAAASFGPWIRHAVFGLMGGVLLVVSGTLFAAGIKNQQPFNRNKVSEGTCIDVALTYLLPAAVVVGPVVGLLVGKFRTVRVHNQ